MVLRCLPQARSLKKWQDEQTDGFDVKEKFSLKFVQA